jgi:hypothetical protein
MASIQARDALARHACRLCFALQRSQQPFDEQSSGSAPARAVTAQLAMPHAGAT